MTVAATRLLLFLLPFLAFLLWLWLIRRMRLGNDAVSPRAEALIVYGGGAVCAAVLAFVIYLATGAEKVDPRSLRYVPAEEGADADRPARFEKKRDDGTT